MNGFEVTIVRIGAGQGRHFYRLWAYIPGKPGYWWGTRGRGWLPARHENMRYYKRYKSYDSAEQVVQLAQQCPLPSEVIA